MMYFLKEYAIFTFVHAANMALHLLTHITIIENFRVPPVVLLCILTRPVKGWLKAQNHKGLVIRLLFLRATTKLIL